MYKWLRYGGIFLCFVAFVWIRFRESELFYDPFIAFFKTDYQAQSLPDFNQTKLLLNLALRYGVHMLLSLGILWLFFKDREVLKFSILLFTGIFVLLMVAFYLMLQGANPSQYQLLFYIRRFLIQPLLILLLLPAFYYYRVSNSE